MNCAHPIHSKMGFLDGKISQANEYIHIRIKSGFSFLFLNQHPPQKDLASNTSGADDDIVIPKGIGVAAVGLPAEVDGGDLGDDGAAGPLAGVGVGGAGLGGGDAGDGGVVEPGLDGAVGAEVVLEALPRPRGQRRRGRDALRRQVRQGRVVRLPVVHEDLALPADPEVLLVALRRVRHRDERDVGVC